jgi:hypothetical protein
MSETTTKSNLIAEQKIVLVDFLEKHRKLQSSEWLLRKKNYSKTIGRIGCNFK